MQLLYHEAAAEWYNWPLGQIVRPESYYTMKISPRGKTGASFSSALSRTGSGPQRPIIMTAYRSLYHIHSAVGKEYQTDA